MATTGKQQLKKWAKTRQMGRTRYIWLYGVIGWGLATGVLWAILMAFLNGRDRLPMYFVLGVIIFPIGGYFFGSWTWAKLEEKFRQAEQDSIPPSSSS
jgi:hypothetical protein